ncbi:MAG: hypothetical protein ABI846_08560 [Rudaea sp.]
MRPEAAFESRDAWPRLIWLLLAAYGVASLVHFIQTPAGVYLAWIAISAVGALGVLLRARGREKAGLCVILVYAACGLDSLGHYLLAPIAQHTHAMNATILFEVGAAALLFLETLRRLARRLLARSPCA